MRFSNIVLLATAGVASATAIAPSHKLQEQELQKRGGLAILCEAVCAVDCLNPVTALTCLACVSLCLATADDDGIVDINKVDTIVGNLKAGAKEAKV